MIRILFGSACKCYAMPRGLAASIPCYQLVAVCRYHQAPSGVSREGQGCWPGDQFVAIHPMILDSYRDESLDHRITRSQSVDSVAKMGSGQSAAARSSYFQNESELSDGEDDVDTHHISISNKMVERLVEDAAVAGAVSGTVRLDKAGRDREARERLLAERLQRLDEMHSQKLGLTVENVNAAARRVELRSTNLPKVDPVCQDCADRLIECYESCDRATNAAKCNDVVAAFAKCVQETAVSRCRARTARDAVEAARRTRDVTHARTYALKDILPPHEVPT
ncbi:hypothetical protein NE865_16008 [Phthorimaea operculella]|nr:hypothetical protein NE865_16008 [Phthorimaea operculella]